MGAFYCVMISTNVCSNVCLPCIGEFVFPGSALACMAEVLAKEKDDILGAANDWTAGRQLPVGF